MNGDVVRGVEFRVRLRGYAPDDVDAFLDVVAAALDAGRPVPASPQVPFRVRLRGYDVGQVDNFLVWIAGQATR